MTREYLRTLYNYSAWATARVLASAAHLDTTELVADGGASFGQCAIRSSTS